MRLLILLITAAALSAQTPGTNTKAAAPAAPAGNAQNGKKIFESGSLRRALEVVQKREPALVDVITQPR
jgi:hypothetical protein